MDFYIERHIAKTNKEHDCWGCCNTISIGSPCLYTVGRNDGYFGHARYCSECTDFMKDPANADWLEGGIAYGDIKYMRREKERELKA